MKTDIFKALSILFKFEKLGLKKKIVNDSSFVQRKKMFESFECKQDSKESMTASLQTTICNCT